jgi:hypothetical protein
MPADNLLNLNLPPIQWTTGTAAHEPQRDPAEGREKRNRKPQPANMAAPAKGSEEPQIEQAAAHEFDSFA